MYIKIISTLVDRNKNEMQQTLFKQDNKCEVCGKPSKSSVHPHCLDKWWNLKEFKNERKEAKRDNKENSKR